MGVSATGVDVVAKATARYAAIRTALGEVETALGAPLGLIRRLNRGTPDPSEIAVARDAVRTGATQAIKLLDDAKIPEWTTPGAIAARARSSMQGSLAALVNRPDEPYWWDTGMDVARAQLGDAQQQTLALETKLAEALRLAMTEA